MDTGPPCSCSLGGSERKPRQVRYWAYGRRLRKTRTSPKRRRDRFLLPDSHTLFSSSSFLTMTIKDAPPASAAPPTSGGPSNQAPLVGESAPPPACSSFSSTSSPSLASRSPFSRFASQTPSPRSTKASASIPNPPRTHPSSLLLLASRLSERELASSRLSSLLC